MGMAQRWAPRQEAPFFPPSEDKQRNDLANSALAAAAAVAVWLVALNPHLFVALFAAQTAAVVVLVDRCAADRCMVAAVRSVAVVSDAGGVVPATVPVLPAPAMPCYVLTQPPWNCHQISSSYLLSSTFAVYFETKF